MSYQEQIDNHVVTREERDWLATVDANPDLLGTAFFGTDDCFMVHELVKRGADPQENLKFAVRISSNLDLLKQLLDYGARPDKDVILSAVSEGRLDKLQVIVAHDPAIIDEDPGYSIAIRVAKVCGQERIAKFLENWLELREALPQNRQEYLEQLEEQIAKAMRGEGAPPKLSELTVDKYGLWASPMEVICDAGKHQLVFQAALWRYREDQVKKLYDDHVPEVMKETIDIDALLQEISRIDKASRDRMQSMRQRFKPSRG